ncbi:hypothetical protein RR48_00494 [Papilio machaon]|uniref:Bromo domain-containing protein n=1 Tax=Papilio machaon TaxID=76193 RepID=A0A0N1IKX1_PAPMA|nr:hypothetical protein RR48_00494 [Papilio machaon]
MDLTLVREKLCDGQYSADADLLADVALVFHNCFTYNKDTHPVANLEMVDVASGITLKLKRHLRTDLENIYSKLNILDLIQMIQDHY